MSTSILQIQPLGFPWPTLDPFLFCVYHDDAYPAGNGAFGPAASLAGRQIGQDFAGKDGWRMYHGRTVPGFPAHPHRGFETVTVVRKGRIDHADSLGATARYGDGDVQWLTTGSGIVHAEMFPLLDAAAPNPLELFQIWLNLPAASKMAAPHFTMFWSAQIPRYVEGGAEVVCIAGRVGDAEGLPPPPDSWAAQAEADLAIWTLKLAPGAAFTLPAAAGAATRRQLYFFKGSALSVDGQAIASHAAIELRGDASPELRNGGTDLVELLLLQGRPIGEPVAQYGPFVMNTEAELRQAFDDYRRTGFGGWPWPDEAPVHGADPQRFARHAGGSEDRPRD
ncbi:pirin family protein [Pelomonas sp. KK5]|uniref:pirin family protein n=1 Tax=Pelomonas sp. KK5 TaxID=1855730 RepID=UPI00097C382E|nr:pirin family protein [Pelomonas sp. KK5]